MLSVASGTGRRYRLTWHSSNPGRFRMSCGAGSSRWFHRGNGSGTGNTSADRERGASRCPHGMCSRPLSMFFVPVASGRLCLENLARPARCTSIFRTGKRQDSFSSCGAPAWPNTTRWKASLGSGRASTGPQEKRRWEASARGRTRPIGGKKGRKRSLLVDGRGGPLSLVGSGANVGDRDLLPLTLDRTVGKRPRPSRKRPQYLCGDAGYRGKPASDAAQSRHYRPHIRQRREEAWAKRTLPGYQARRWVVERTHSWLNRFRKLLVSFEKTEASYTALLSLAAALICWRQTLSIYG